MEYKHKELIIQHLPQLVSCTICGDLFLAYFLAKNVLSDVDLQNINAAGTNYGQISKSYKFYEILLTKCRSFPVLTEALQQTNQTGALNLLSYIDPQKSSPIVKFSRPPKRVEEFMESATQKVLVFNSRDCKITCDWICDTVNNSKLYNFHECLEFLSRKLTSKDITNNLAIINCENEDVGHIIRSLFNTPGKFIVVGLYEGKSSQSTHSVITERIHWDHLSPLFSHEILQNIKSTLGLNRTDIEVELQNLEECVIHKLINGEIPILFKDTIPDLIQYYIPRRLLTRYVISSKLFSHDGPDIFLFAGIERHQLTELAAGKVTATSSECNSKSLEPGTKLVLLEDDEHFDKIVASNPDRPVHQLKCSEERYIWVKSSAGLRTIQAFVLDVNQDIITESEFVTNIAADNSIDPVCISDTPGMGKSTLLGHIGKELQKTFSPGSIVFIFVSELVEQTRQWKNADNLKDNVLAVLAETFCENKLGMAYIKQYRHTLKHLLLDGLDEVNASVGDIQFAYKLINVLHDIFPHTRIWIATRPHMFLELEKQVNVLGYNIEAFADMDQINFLESFWSKDWNEEFQPKAPEKLSHFAKECLKTIKSKIVSEQEQDIAGIPLQCLLIGEVFMDQAQTYCGKADSALPSFNVKSVSDLYKQLMLKKFDKFRERYNRKNLDDADLEKAHILLSIRLLFPAYEHIFSTELDTASLSIQDIFDVGIIESVNPNTIVRFIHRTFAEFFLAIFLLESFYNNWTPTKSDFFVNQVLETTPTYLLLNSFNMRTYQFSHNVICYFIDSYLEKYQMKKINSKQIKVTQKSDMFFNMVLETSRLWLNVKRIGDVASWIGNNALAYLIYSYRNRKRKTVIKTDIIDKSMDIEKLQSIAEACAHGCFEEIFMKLVYAIIFQSEYKNELYSENFLFVCTARAGVKMLSCVYSSFKEIVAVNAITEIKKEQFTLLHIAVSRGEYSLVEHIIEKQGCRKYLRENEVMFYNLIHECVKYSMKEDPRILREKSQIIRYIANINIDLLTTSDGQNIPLLSPGIHVDLAMEVLSAAKKTTPHEYILKFLHSSLKLYSSNEYHLVLNHVLKEVGAVRFSNLWIQTFKGSFLLHRLFEQTEPSKMMLDFLLNSGVSFSKDNENEESVLEINVKCQKSITCISWLLKNIKFTEKQLKSAFISSVTCVNVDVLTVFLEGGNVDFGILNFRENNMWQLVFNKETKLTKKHCKLSQKLIKHGIFLNVKTLRGEGPLQILTKMTSRSQEWWDLFNLCFNHIYSTTNNIWVAKIDYFLRQSGFEHAKNFKDLLQVCAADNNINQTDKDGNTLLHLLWKSKFVVSYSWEIWKILIEGGVNVLALNNNKENYIRKLVENSDSNMEWTEQLTAALHLLETIQILETSKINDIIIAIVRHCTLNVVKEVVGWYVANVRLPVDSITGNYKGRLATLIDMTFLSFDGDVLEFLCKHHACSLLLHHDYKTCIHKCVQSLHANKKRLKFITVVNSIYPNLVNQTDEKGLVPLSMRLWDPIYVRHLVKLGANVNAVDPFGNTPLHWALKNIHTTYPVVEALVKCGADVTVETANNETPLSLCLQGTCVYKGVLKLLIKNNADAAKQNANGDTVLHLLLNKQFFLSTDFQEIVELLLEKGFRNLFDLRNNKNVTPLQIMLQLFPSRHPAIQLIDDHRTGTRQK